MSSHDDRFGWRPEPDRVRAIEFPKRFARYPMLAATPDAPFRPRVSYRTPILDQIGPSCVGYSIRTKLDSAPVRTKRGPDGLTIYRVANSRDEWSPTPHDGTSVRAGMDVVLEHGLIEGYNWATSIDDVIQFLGRGGGPVIAGTWWTAGMSDPAPKTGLIRPTGPRQGGHAYCVRRLDFARGLLWIAQTWGRSWGINGYCCIQVEDLEMLVFQQGGEIATAIETRRAAVTQ